MATLNILCDTYEDIEIADLQGIETAIADMRSDMGKKDSFIGKVKNSAGKIKTGTHVESGNAENLKKEINERILSVIPAINQEIITDNGFELAEMEITVGFKVEAGITVPCLSSAGASANSSITFKIRKRQMGSEE